MSWSVFLGGNHFRFPVEFTVLRIRKYTPHFFKKKKKSKFKRFFFFFYNARILKRNKVLVSFVDGELAKRKERRSSTTQQGESGRSSFGWYWLASSSFWWCYFSLSSLVGGAGFPSCFWVLLFFPLPLGGGAVLLLSPKESSNEMELV